jgi:hypothetical protein
MPEPSRAPNSSGINQLNIGLMLASCLAAMLLPFQLFLFSYAILGPAHYLTEISWLHKRHFFTKGRHDYWLLVALAALFVTVVFLSGSSAFSASLGPERVKITSTITFFAFGSALVFMLTDRVWHRALGLAVVMALSLLSVTTNTLLAWMIALFVVTLIHVYVFTGFFILQGALKERSRSGYLSFCIFLLCPLLLIFVQPQVRLPSEQIISTYWNQFGTLNLVLLGIRKLETQADLASALELVFKSQAGHVVMRFVAFAYTYHYLNWFSKTSLIKWHQIPRKRLALLGGLWLTCIALYLYDYGLGYKVLLCLSLIHVYLEFPLNHMSFIGTFRELAGRWWRTTPKVVSPASTRADIHLPGEKDNQGRLVASRPAGGSARTNIG